MKKRTNEFLESFDKIDLEVRINYYVKTITIIIAIALIIPLYSSVFVYYNYNVSISFIVEYLILLWIYWLVNKEKTQFAANLLVYSILILSLALFYTGKYGIRDVSILIFPGLLIFTGIIFNKRKYIFFSTILISSFTLYTILEIYGILTPNFSSKITFATVINADIILIMTFLGVYFLTNDLRKSMEKLKKSGLEFFHYQNLSQEKLKKSEKELQELNSTKDIFLSVVAHDLKSPFQGLLGISDLLSNEFDSLTKNEVKQYIDNLSDGLKSQYLLLEDLLQWGRLQRGTIPFEPKRDDIFDLISESIQFFVQSAGNKNISILNHSKPDTFFEFDRYLISIVIRNLLSNAIKFSFPGGVILIASELTGNKLTVKVKDSGVGIESKFKNRIFKLDSTFSTPGTKNETGTGLGLLLCHDIIIKHNGKISFSSQPGKGSEFVFSIYN